MATVYVVHADGDEAFVRQRVLPVLPGNGHDCWVTRQHLIRAGGEAPSWAQAMEQCAAILIVISPAMLRSAETMAELELALTAKRPLIAIQIAALDGDEAARIPAWLRALPVVDFDMEEEDEAERLLLGLLPPVECGPDRDPPQGAELIEWDADIFSAALLRATTRHDHALAEVLVTAIVRHLAHRGSGYPAQYASYDLQLLRQEREFGLMLRYAEAAIASGTRRDKVRRLFSQALIETGQHDHALEVLQSILTDADTSQGERFEAQGLIGRVYKQRYMDAPDAPEAPEYLRRAILYYVDAYKQDGRNYWHGVNAVSCMLRAERDGIADMPQGLARQMAAQIAEELEARAKEGPLDVWDYASQVEALLALERYKEADRVLGNYLHHPKMMAFEVSSTFRQFAQVLGLGRALGSDPEGDQMRASILGRLGHTMERYRAGRARAKSDIPASQPDTGKQPLMRPLVIRLADPSNVPEGVTDLVIQSGMGKIITARGSDQSVRELLADARVMSVEESRPVVQLECVRSMPFIKATGPFAHPAGSYSETGDLALIAVIDNGIDVLHRAFLDADGASRIVGIWDQTDKGGPAPEGFSFGTYHSASAIADYVQGQPLPRGLKRNEGGHGTHVASIAAGRAVGAFSGGVAPDAKLLIVVSGSGGLTGYSQSHVEALAFIDRESARLDLPVVVNVSQGMNAGAHDGKSALEVAFDAFSSSGRKPGRVVVKSAGNERAKGGHAKVTLPPGSLEQLIWRRSPGAHYAERIELWWSSADEIGFRLRQPLPAGARPGDPVPDEFWSEWVSMSAPERQGKFPNGSPYRMAFTRRHVDNGDSQLLIELGGDAGSAAYGDWILELQSGDVPEGGEVHAWIERSQGMPTTFLTHGNEEMTLSIPGTAQSVIAVSAIEACRPIRVGEFSSYGPTRDGQKKPLVCAPGVRVLAAEGGTADGVMEQSGTSMASPHVAGAIALVLSRTAKAGHIPSGNQIASALRQKTQNYNGRWDIGQGYGVVDVGALLAAFE